MRKRQSIADARSNLPQLVREAESGEPIELTRRGESVAVLIGHRHFEHLSRQARRFSEAWKEFVRDIELSDAAIDPDEVFDDVRDERPGRDVRL